MLVLRQKIGETVAIDEDIKIHVLDVDGKYVKLGFEAPRGISVYRGTIAEKIRKEKEDTFLEKIAESDRRNEESAKELGMSLNDFVE